MYFSLSHQIVIETVTQSFDLLTDVWQYQSEVIVLIIQFFLVASVLYCSTTMATRIDSTWEHETSLLLPPILHSFSIVFHVILSRPLRPEKVCLCRLLGFLACCLYSYTSPVWLLPSFFKALLYRWCLSPGLPKRPKRQSFTQSFTKTGEQYWQCFWNQFFTEFLDSKSQIEPIICQKTI